MHADDTGLLSSAIRRFLAALYVLALIILVGEAVLLLAPQVTGQPAYLTREQRFVVGYLGWLPIAFFSVGYYFFECRQASTRPFRSHLMLALVTAVGLWIPSAAVVMRYGLPPAWQVWVTGIGFAVAGVVMTQVVIRDTDSGARWVRAHRYFKYVMQDHWHVLNRPSALEQVFEGNDVAAAIFTPADPAQRRTVIVSRESAYVDKQNIIAFQELLTCPEIDAEVTADALGGRLPASVSVLDIGCGDGEYTSNLLRRLGSRTVVTSIVGLDPVDWESEFTQAVRPWVGAVSFRRGQLDAIGDLPHFDLVIASHSLYRECDSADSNPDAVWERVLAPILGRVRAGGVLVVIMASRRGAAYGFKEAATSWLFGERWRDASSETVRLSLDSDRARDSVEVEEFRVDDAMDLTRPLVDYHRSDPKELLRFACYFLRATPEALRPVLAETADALFRYIAPFDYLSEGFQKSLRKVGRIRFAPTSLVLPHKVSVFIVTRFGNLA